MPSALVSPPVLLTCATHTLRYLPRLGLCRFLCVGEPKGYLLYPSFLVSPLRARTFGSKISSPLVTPTQLLPIGPRASLHLDIRLPRGIPTFPMSSSYNDHVRHFHPPFQESCRSPLIQQPLHLSSPFGPVHQPQHATQMLHLLFMRLPIQPACFAPFCSTPLHSSRKNACPAHPC